MLKKIDSEKCCAPQVFNISEAIMLTKVKPSILHEATY